MTGNTLPCSDGPPRASVGNPRYGVGVINHHTYGRLARCLDSLARQSVAPRETMVVDCDAIREKLSRLQRHYPDVIWIDCANIGFSAAANRITARFARADAAVDFVLLLNADVELDEAFVATVLREMEEWPSVALASGKLLRPDGRTIDSAGIILPRSRRPQDRGSGEEDRGQYDESEVVFAVSGAATMLRCEALADLQVDGELFDEDFFSYHEDTDLGWRAGQLGWASLYVPSARATHSRGWRPEQSAAIPSRVRRHSFKNHYLQMIKNERASTFYRDLPVILAWEVARLLQVLSRRPSMLPAYGAALRLVPRAWRKRRIIQLRMRETRGQEQNATCAT